MTVLRLAVLVLCFVLLGRAMPKLDSDHSSTFVQPFPMAKCQGLELEDASIDTIQGWLSSGKLTSVNLVQCYLERVQAVDGHVR